MDSSIGFAVAKFAQEQGATVLISNFGRALGITRRIAKRLPTEPPVLVPWRNTGSPMWCSIALARCPAMSDIDSPALSPRFRLAT